jgi:hypothetical protein
MKRHLNRRSRPVYWLCGAMVCLGFIGLGLASGDAMAAVSKDTLSKPDAARQTALRAAYGKLPLSFEANRGQTDAQVKFLSRGRGYSLFLTPKEAVLALRKPAEEPSATASTASRKTQTAEAEKAKPQTKEPAQAAVLRLQLVGANPIPKVVGEGPLPGKSNYFIGKDPKKWHTNIAHYDKVRYESVYPGIDLVYYGNQRQLECDFVVAPGADPKAIRLAFKGAEKLSLNQDGQLVLGTGGGKVIQHAPGVYQEVGGKRQAIPARYVLTGSHQVSFQVAAYDATRSLIIDPVLSYSTYLGGSDLDDSEGITVDEAGNIYVTGGTLSPDFPTVNALQLDLRFQDTFVTKLNAKGDALVYFTYLGGSGSDRGSSIAVDDVGRAYVTGETRSNDFPTANALQPNFGGGFLIPDAFVAKLNVNGDTLIYSTYLGGSESDSARDIAVDEMGHAYVAGQTGSMDFSTIKSLQPALNGSTDAFVAKFNVNGDALTYSTYLGGSGSDGADGIAVDDGGNVYVAGQTFSKDFPTINALQPTLNGFNNDAFVAKLNVNGDALVYSTYLGGKDHDTAFGIAVDEVGHAYVAGGTTTFTGSTDFPTTVNALQPNFGGGLSDAFIAKLNVNGDALVYSTYVGGSDGEYAEDIAVDRRGNVYVLIQASAPDLPTVKPLQPNFGGGSDAFIAKLNVNGDALVFSTFLGGSGVEDIGSNGIAVDVRGNIYVTGATTSQDFPTVNPIQPEFGGGLSAGDAFVAKIAPAVIVNDLVELEQDPPPTSFSDTPAPNAPAGTFTLTATFTNTSSETLADPLFAVIELTGGNLLLNADGGPGGLGNRLTPNVGPDGAWTPGETVEVAFEIGLQAKNPFRFLVNLLVEGTDSSMAENNVVTKSYRYAKQTIKRLPSKRSEPFKFAFNPRGSGGNTGELR